MFNIILVWKDKESIPFIISVIENVEEIKEEETIKDKQLILHFNNENKTIINNYSHFEIFEINNFCKSLDILDQIKELINKIRLINTEINIRKEEKEEKEEKNRRVNIN